MELRRARRRRRGDRMPPERRIVVDDAWTPEPQPKGNGKNEAGYYGVAPPPPLVNQSPPPAVSPIPVPPILLTHAKPLPATVTHYVTITATPTPSPPAPQMTPPVPPAVVLAPALPSSPPSSSSSSYATTPTRPLGLVPTGKPPKGPQREKDPDPEELNDRPPPPDYHSPMETSRNTAIAMSTIFGVAMICSVLFCIYWYRKRKAKKAKKAGLEGYPHFPRESQQPITARAMAQSPPPPAQGQDKTQSAIINEMMAAAYAAEQGYYETPRGSSMPNAYPTDEKTNSNYGGAFDTRESTYSYASSRASSYTMAGGGGQGPPTTHTSLRMPPQHPSRQFAFLQHPPPNENNNNDGGGGGYGDLLSLYARTSRTLSGVFNRRPSGTPTPQELDGREAVGQDNVNAGPGPGVMYQPSPQRRAQVVSMWTETTATSAVESKSGRSESSWGVESLRRELQAEQGQAGVEQGGAEGVVYHDEGVM